MPEFLPATHDQEANSSTPESVMPQPEIEDIEARRAQYAREWDELSDRFGDKIHPFSHHYAQVAPLKEEDESEYREFITMVGSRPQVMQHLNGLKELVSQANEILATLEKDTPELLAGRLPADQEEALGNERYAIGANQSSASTEQEALKYLQENGGVKMGKYRMTGRFRIWDEAISQSNPDIVREALSVGYTGRPSIFRNIVAVPLDAYYAEEGTESVNGQNAANEAEDFNVVPDDFSLVGEGEWTVNAKYIAGFVDGQGKYHKNKNFAKSDQFELETHDLDNTGEQ